MNERIKQLALQAGMVKILEEHAHEYGNGMFENTPYLELEKFAELIVRECVELVSATRDLAIEDGWNVDEAMSIAINDIEEHFGVNE